MQILFLRKESNNSNLFSNSSLSYIFTSAILESTPERNQRCLLWWQGGWHVRWHVRHLVLSWPRHGIHGNVIVHERKKHGSLNKSRCGHEKWMSFPQHNISRPRNKDVVTSTKWQHIMIPRVNMSFPWMNISCYYVVATTKLSGPNMSPPGHRSLHSACTHCLLNVNNADCALGYTSNGGRR